MNQIRVLLITLCVAIAGCSTLRTLAEKYDVPEKAARAVNQYCRQVPLEDRLKNRAAVNALAAPDSAHIHCDGDPIAQ